MKTTRLLSLVFIGFSFLACSDSTVLGGPPDTGGDEASNTGGDNPADTPTDTPVSGADTQYLLFQMGAMMPMLGDMPGTFVATKADMASHVDAVLEAIDGMRGDGVKQQLGFSFGPLAFDLTDAQMQNIIADVFAIAEEKDVAVAFHIEDSMFWKRRSDLWSVADNVEWSDWAGTTVPHRIIGWAANGAPILAPPMCYTSPIVVTETARIARDIMGAAIARGVDHLKSLGKEKLFAGVIAGWETRLQDDSYDPPHTLGYCALHHLGYSEQSPPADLDAAWVAVVHDWVALWTNSLAAAGLPRERIFTHIGVAGTPPPQFTNPVRDFFKDSPADVTAFTDTSRAGFSVYGESAFPTIYAMMQRHDGAAWGISEGTAVDLGAAAPAPDAMERYLARAYNHGARYVNVFGWGDGDSPYAQATTSAASKSTYEKFLRGEDLNE